MINPFRKLLRTWFGVAPVPTYRNPRKGWTKRASSFRPILESLEDRLAPASLVVNSLDDNTTDTSVLTLREAIVLTNNGGNPGALGQSSMPTGWKSQITGGFGDDAISFDSTLFTSGPQIINLSTIEPNLTATKGPSDLVINTKITIFGPTGIGPSGDYGLTLDNTAPGQRLFYVAPTGNLTLDDLTLTGGQATGQAGQAGGGGGGAGMGGAVFVDGLGGVLNLNECTLSGNTATGGNGGAGFFGSAPTYSVPYGAIGPNGFDGGNGGGFGTIAQPSAGFYIGPRAGGLGGLGGAYIRRNVVIYGTEASAGSTVNLTPTRGLPGQSGDFGGGGGGGGGGGAAQGGPNLSKAIT
jgi:hypothetical protein